VLAAAAITGVDRVFTIGGAQAVAALAYGTHSIPQVDKIVGPGNAYVAAPSAASSAPSASTWWPARPRC
jgi:histidinol dehydrogenase